MKIFLGGTCNGSTWRDYLIPRLPCNYFNPVVENWDEQARNIENEEKFNCDILLFTITKEMSGVYSIAEVADASNKYPERTIFCVLKEGMSEELLNSLQAVEELVRNNGAKVVYSLDEVLELINIKNSGKAW